VVDDLLNILLVNFDFLLVTIEIAKFRMLRLLFFGFGIKSAVVCTSSFFALIELLVCIFLR